jgi:hypothetical protein
VEVLEVNGGRTIAWRYGGEIRRLARSHPYLVACIALSIALHVALLWGLRHSASGTTRPTDESNANWLTVTFRALTAPKAAPEAAPRETPAPAKPPKRAAESAAKPVAYPPDLARPQTPPILHGPDNSAATSGRPAESAPAIDLDAARRFAREAGRSRSGVIAQDLRNFEPAQPEIETAAARAIAKAARPDCRTEYAGMGLFAIPFLLKDTVTDSGCKW